MSVKFIFDRDDGSVRIEADDGAELTEARTLVMRDMARSLDRFNHNFASFCEDFMAKSFYQEER